MKDSADIRRINKEKILSELRKGRSYTKQQIAVTTGLSVATCNTLLNDMEQCGEVTGEKVRLQEVGRSTILYKINETYESFLCVTFDMINGNRQFTQVLLSPAGTVLEQKKAVYEYLDFTAIVQAVGDTVEAHGNISQIMVGTPSIAEHGVIRHCDIPELEGECLVEKLSKQFDLPVHMENDMHFKVYGCYKKQGMPDGVITLANFPEHILPGTASVHGGTIIKGKNQFAGMVGFLPYGGKSRKEEIAMLKMPECLPLIENAIFSIIVMINPDIIIFTGNLLNEKILETFYESCLHVIPDEYMPQFLFEENMDGYYLEGMYQKTLDLKEVL